METLRETKWAQAVENAKIDRLGHAPHVAVHDALVHTKHFHGGAHMDVLPGAEGFDEHWITAHMRQEAELDLRVVSQHVPRCSHEGSAHLPPKFGTNGDVLQIGIAAAQAPRLGDGLVK